MKGYVRYKPSGIEWIREIPEHWDINKLKYMTDNLDKNRIPLSSSERSGKQGEYPYYGATGIIDHIDGYIFDGDYVLIGEDGAPFFEKNRDVAFVASGKFWVNNHAHILRAREGYLPGLIAHQLNCVDYREYISGSTRDKLTQDELNGIRLINIPKEEQAKIIEYLDRKIGQIDDLITKKQKLIDLRNGEKTAIINQAVTKGLDPNTPMKDSGIHWLGEIPANWEVKKLKYLAWAINEKTEHDIEFKISLENIESKTGRLISLENENNFQGELRKFQKGDVLFNKLRPYLAKAYLADNNGGCLGELLIFRSKGELIPTFLFYRVLSYDFIKIVDSSTYGSKMPRASWDDFISQLLIPYPQNDEQTAIANYLDRKTDQMDDVISKTHHEIELLQEYRTALISEAVTGKIDVRGVN